MVLQILYFEGMILAPCATITMIGTGSSSTYYGQIIGWNVMVGGNNDTGVIYDGDLPGEIATRIELFR